MTGAFMPGWYASPVGAIVRGDLGEGPKQITRGTQTDAETALLNHEHACGCCRDQTTAPLLACHPRELGRSRKRHSKKRVSKKNKKIHVCLQYHLLLLREHVQAPVGLLLLHYLQWAQAVMGTSMHHRVDLVIIVRGGRPRCRPQRVQPMSLLLESKPRGRPS